MKSTRMILLLDIGNTHTHVGLADETAVRKARSLRTQDWFAGGTQTRLTQFVGRVRLAGVALCSVVPNVTPYARRWARVHGHPAPLELNARTATAIRIHYPRPSTIGADRLANAVAVRHHFGAPAVVVDFGTAVTFDVVNGRGEYVGGIIAPGLSAMTDYLYEKTALLPQLRIREVSSVIGKSTTEAMLIGAVHGYRGLIRELLRELKRELRVARLPVVATGGYAGLIVAKLPEITAVEPHLTLEGLRLVQTAAHAQNRLRFR